MAPDVILNMDANREIIRDTIARLADCDPTIRDLVVFTMRTLADEKAPEIFVTMIDMLIVNELESRARELQRLTDWEREQRGDDL